MRSLKVAADMSNISTLMNFVQKNIAEYDFNKEKINYIEISCEEILINIIKYAYPEKPGDIEISFENVNDEYLKIEIIDWGVHFDILSVPEPDTEAPLEERNHGGLGIFFARQMMDEIQYMRAGDKNRVILKKYHQNRRESD